jgi:hypothetical protein
VNRFIEFLELFVLVLPSMHPASGFLQSIQTCDAPEHMVARESICLLAVDTHFEESTIWRIVPELLIFQLIHWVIVICSTGSFWNFEVLSEILWVI